MFSELDSVNPSWAKQSRPPCINIGESSFAQAPHQRIVWLCPDNVAIRQEYRQVRHGLVEPGLHAHDGHHRDGLESGRPASRRLSAGRRALGWVSRGSAGTALLAICPVFFGCATSAFGTSLSPAPGKFYEGLARGLSDRPSGRPSDRPPDRPTARPADRPTARPTARPPGRLTAHLTARPTARSEQFGSVSDKTSITG